jgi:hypothetical protein
MKKILTWHVCFFFFLHKCKMCGKIEDKENLNQISMWGCFLGLFFMCWGEVGGVFTIFKMFPIASHFLFNMLCTKLSFFHLHNWAKKEVFHTFEFENKTFYFGMLQSFSHSLVHKIVTKVKWTQSLFYPTLNCLSRITFRMCLTWPKPMMKYNGGIMNKTKFSPIFFHIFISLSSPLVQIPHDFKNRMIIKIKLKY